MNNPNPRQNLKFWYVGGEASHCEEEFENVNTQIEKGKEKATLNVRSMAGLYLQSTSDDQTTWSHVNTREPENANYMQYEN